MLNFLIDINNASLKKHMILHNTTVEYTTLHDGALTTLERPGQSAGCNDPELSSGH